MSQPWPGVALIVASLSGCFATRPRLEDAPAPSDPYLQTKAPQCEPLVELLRSESQARRPYREVASLSASCYPGAHQICEHRLLERACALKAEAVILKPAVPGGTPPGASNQSLISLHARAVRWLDEQPGQ